MFSILSLKQCITCKKWKPKGQFHKNKRKKDGYHWSCKECRSIYRRGAYAQNPEPVKAQKKAWNDQHKTENLARALKWQTENPDKVAARQKRYYSRYPEKVTEKNHKRRFLKLASGGTVTSKEWRSLKEFYGYSCLCCKRREPDIKLELDHVNPLAQGGSNTIDNIQPLCVSCNRKKGTKHIDYR
jgi:5-methylcytosine-specific restriction endonuclease McrA